MLLLKWGAHCWGRLLSDGHFELIDLFSYMWPWKENCSAAQETYNRLQSDKLISLLCPIGPYCSVLGSMLAIIKIQRYKVRVSITVVSSMWVQSLTSQVLMRSDLGVMNGTSTSIFYKSCMPSFHCGHFPKLLQPVAFTFFWSLST